MSEIQNILGQNFKLATDAGSKILQYREAGKPEADFCVNTRKQEAATIDLLKKSGVLK